MTEVVNHLIITVFVEQHLALLGLLKSDLISSCIPDPGQTLHCGSHKDRTINWAKLLSHPKTVWTL